MEKSPQLHFLAHIVRCDIYFSIGKALQVYHRILGNWQCANLPTDILASGLLLGSN